MAMQTKRNRQATPQRWQRALRRAIDGDVRVVQLQSTGQWIATSASDPTSAYELEVVNGSAVGCSCPAAQFGNDPVCLHRAAYWHLVGILDLDDEAPAPSSTVDPLATRYYAADGQFAGSEVVIQPNPAGNYRIIDETRRRQLGPSLPLADIVARLAKIGFQPIAA